MAFTRERGLRVPVGASQHVNVLPTAKRYEAEHEAGIRERNRVLSRSSHANTWFPRQSLHSLPPRIFRTRNLW